MSAAESEYVLVALSRANFPTRALAFFANCALCAVLVFAGSDSAAASVSQAVRGGVKTEPTVSQARQQIDELQSKMAAATEEFDQARVVVQKSQDTAAQLQPQVQAARSEVTKHQAEVGKLANLVYSQGNLEPMSLIAGSRNASSTIEQFTVLQQIQQDRQTKIAKLAKAKRALEGKEKSITDEMTEQKKQLDIVRKKQSSITEDLAKWQALRSQLAGGVRDRVYGAVAYTGQGVGDAAKAVQFALAQQGKMYLWGAAGPALYDCSGLTMAAWRAGGKSLPHSAQLQYNVVKKVSRSEMQPGALVFYGSPAFHVALYIGGGQVVHASQPGSPIHVASMDGAGGSPISGIGQP